MTWTNSIEDLLFGVIISVTYWTPAITCRTPSCIYFYRRDSRLSFSLMQVLKNISDDHPLQIALRTYSLCLSLRLGPALLRLILALAAQRKNLSARASAFWRVLSKELRPTGFAWAITAAVGGGAALQRLWDVLRRRHLWAHYINSKSSPWQRAFLANAATSTLAVALLRRKRHGRVSPTLDLTLLFFFRALDAFIQALLHQRAREVARRVHASPDNGVAPQLPDASSLDRWHEDLARDWQKRAATHLDALFFWASSARFVTVHLIVFVALRLFSSKGSCGASSTSLKGMLFPPYS